MNVKRILWMSMIAVAALATLTVTSCSLSSASSERARISMFQDAINNGSVSTIMDNFSSSMSDYNNMNTQTYWDTSVFAKSSGTFTITTSGTVVSDTQYTTDGMKETETITNGVGSTYTIIFWFTNPTGNNWLIRAIDYNSGATVLYSSK